MNPHALNKLLQVWPRDGARNTAEFMQLQRVASALGIEVNPRVSRDQLRRTVCSCMGREAAARCVQRSAATVPWKYQKYFRPNQNVRQQAIKIQPGVTIPVAFGGMETTVYVDTARRTSFRGKPWYVELKIKLSTENLPVILTRESKCTCLYCGTDPRGDEDSCRSCGAPLPDC
jgi:hypothetical protein